MYDMKALYEAKSVGDAIRLLQEHPQAQIIAGGSDVLVQMREGKRAGVELVSIYGLDELRGVTMEKDGTIRIGSLTSFSHITKDPLIQKYIAVLGEAVDMAGGPQIRNIGTIGGNTCNGVTSADSASTLFAWDARIELTGPEGVRVLPIRDFYIKAGKVDIRPGEIQTAILIPRESYEGYAGHYIKYAMRNAMDIATLGCSVNVKLSDDKKTFTDIRIAYGVAGPCVQHMQKRPGEVLKLRRRALRRSAILYSRTLRPATAGVPARRSGNTSQESFAKELCVRRSEGPAV